MTKLPPLPLGYKDRGLLAAAYPTYEQVDRMEEMQPSMLAAWNWMVARQEEVLRAQEARALRLGLVPPAPKRPDYKGMTPEESEQAKEAYVQLCKDRRETLFNLKECPVEWRPFLDGKNSEAERLDFKQDYQVINWYLRCRGLEELPAAIIDSLIYNFNKKSDYRKKFRKSWEVMPIQVRTGPHLRLRELGKGPTWHTQRCNAEVNLPGVGWIAIYLDPGLVNSLLTPGNTTRGGCTLIYEAGNWYASVKLIQRIPDRSGPGNDKVVGIDPGLAKIATWYDGEKSGFLVNHRDLAWTTEHDTAVSIADTLRNTVKGRNDEEAEAVREEARHAKHQIYRHDAKQKRRALTQCRQLAAFIASNYQYIGFEKNHGIALGIGSRYTSSTRILYSCLLDKCGPDRLKEVDSYYNSQICSKCGHHDKETWQRKLGEVDQTCRCLMCGFQEDRDVNAASNVRGKRIEMLLDLAA